jgi:hypothetical protein
VRSGALALEGGASGRSWLKAGWSGALREPVIVAARWFAPFDEMWALVATGGLPGLVVDLVPL